MKNYKNKYRNTPELVGFWENIKLGYDKFYKEGKELKVRVNSLGNYTF